MKIWNFNSEFENLEFEHLEFENSEFEYLEFENQSLVGHCDFNKN